MDSNIQLQYLGYLKTPKLWNDNNIYNLQQLDWSPVNHKNIQLVLSKGIRLGKRVEQFVFHELKQLPNTTILAENLQIQLNKHTLGEIDTLLVINNKPVHLEIIYKFYLYDETVGETDLDHWIGPNRKDSLVEKLEKLKNKQLPLLYHTETLKYLHKYNIKIDKISQQVLFKAQLFVPFHSKKTDHKFINKACIIGFYLKKHDLALFKDCKFYMPSKANWLVDTHSQVPWQEYKAFIDKISPVLDKQTAPLIWIKQPNGEIDKVFIVWW